MHSSAPAKEAASRLLNIGTGVETSVNRLTEAIIAATGFNGARIRPLAGWRCAVPASSTPEPPSTSSAGALDQLGGWDHKHRRVVQGSRRPA